jgi:hypothetical protein
VSVQTVSLGAIRTAVSVTSPREDAVTAFLGALLVGGVLTDAWAHTNRLSTLENFFTPWHAMLYTGFAATAAWTVWLAYRRRTTPRWWRDAWPAGYAVGAVGAAMFAAGGVGDMAWHTIFGIEVGLKTALSPTHLLLDMGAVLLLTSPLRSWWAANSGGPRAAAGLVSMGLGVTMATVLLLNVSPFVDTAPTQTYEPGLTNASHLAAVRGFSGYLIFTVVLVAPFLLAHRRRATFGAATAVVGLVAAFAVLTFDAPRVQLIAAVTALVGAALADLAVVRLDAVRGPDAALRLPIAGALVAALVWSGHLLGLHLATGVHWPPELWAGTVVLTALLGALLGGLGAGGAWTEERRERSDRSDEGRRRGKGTEARASGASATGQGLAARPRT